MLGISLFFVLRSECTNIVFENPEYL